MASDAPGAGNEWLDHSTLACCLAIGALPTIGKGGAVPLGPSGAAVGGSKAVAGDLHTDWLLGL